MGKGFNNFMSKKGFHPSSHANQKRIQEAEEEAAAKKKHEEETLAQYQKEQELFHQRSLISKESKEKLSLSFMYDPPPGLSKGDDSSSVITPRIKPKQERKDLSSDDESEVTLTWTREKKS